MRWPDFILDNISVGQFRKETRKFTGCVFLLFCQTSYNLVLWASEEKCSVLLMLTPPKLHPGVWCLTCHFLCGLYLIRHFNVKINYFSHISLNCFSRTLFLGELLSSEVGREESMVAGRVHSN